MLEQTPSSGVPVAVLFLDSSETEGTRVGLTGFELGTLVEDIAENIASRIGPAELVCCVDPGIVDIVRGDAQVVQELLTDLVWGVVSVSSGGEVVMSARVVDERGARVGICFEVVSRSVGADVDPWDERVRAAFSHPEGTDAVAHLAVDSGVERPTRGVLRKWVTLEFDVVSGPSKMTVPYALRGRRVLVVDDSATVRELLRDLLESWGLSVTVVPSARAALTVLGAASAKGRSYDLMIFDQQMPDVPGESLARILADDPRLREAPVLLLVSAGSRRPRHSIGVAAEVRKPIRRQSLLGCTIALLRR